MSGGLDSTHAPGSWPPRRWTGARAATSWYSPCPGSPPASAPRATRSNCPRPSGLRCRDRHPQDGRTMLAEIGHPLRAARRSTTSPSRTSRPACAPTTCSGIANQRGGIVLGTGDLSELALAGLPTVSATDVALQRQRRRAENAYHPASDPVGHRSGEFDDEVGVIPQSVLDTEITPGTRTDRRGRRDPERARPRSAPAHSAGLLAVHQVLRHGFDRRRSRSWPTRLERPRPRRLAARFPTTSASPTPPKR